MITTIDRIKELFIIYSKDEITAIDIRDNFLSHRISKYRDGKIIYYRYTINCSSLC